jgi:hypothetical protein
MTKHFGDRSALVHVPALLTAREFLRLDLLFSPNLLRRSRARLNRFFSSGFLMVLMLQSCVKYAMVDSYLKN